MSEWISVKERLPQSGSSVIVSLIWGDQHDIDIDKIVDIQSSEPWETYYMGVVTRWMPIPEPPVV
jgi:hypothetical protein